MTLAESLRRFRNDFHLSQKQVASAGNVSWQSYQSYEGGKASPSVKIIMNIADAYNVSTDYLLGRSDEPRPVPADKALVDAIINARDSIQKVLSEVDKVAEGAKQQ